MHWLLFCLIFFFHLESGSAFPTLVVFYSSNFAPVYSRKAEHLLRTRCAFSTFVAIFESTRRVWALNRKPPPSKVNMDPRYYSSTIMRHSVLDCFAWNGHPCLMSCSWLASNRLCFYHSRTRQVRHLVVFSAVGSENSNVLSLLLPLFFLMSNPADCYFFLNRIITGVFSTVSLCWSQAHSGRSAMCRY